MSRCLRNKYKNIDKGAEICYNLCTIIEKEKYFTKRITTVFLVLSVTLTALFTPFFNVHAEEQNEIFIEEMLFEPAYTPAERSTQNANNSGISPRAIIEGDSRSFVEDVSLSPYCKNCLY